MIGLREILIIAVVFVVAWYGLRYIGVLDARRKAERKFARDAARTMTDDPRDARAAGEDEGIDTEFDPATGSYVPKDDKPGADRGNGR